MHNFAYSVLLLCLMFVALVVAADNLPDVAAPEQTAPITCAGKKNCEVARFEMSEGRFAYCELRWHDDGRKKAGRCVVDPKRDQ